MTQLLRLIPLAFLTACSGTGTEPGSAVAIKFSAISPTNVNADASPSFSAAGASAAELAVTGSNGTLAISDIRLIVAEFELEPVEVADCDVEPRPAGCADFESRFFFIDVPLTGQPLTIVNANIPAGMYNELELEVDDAEVDTDDPEDAADAALIQALFNRIRNDEGFADWPEKASMVIVGTFTPTGGTPVPFRTYFEAEIEVELEFNPALEIAESVSRSVVIQLNPELWFQLSDGTTMDLSQSDYPSTGSLVQFELEIENGFELEIEI